MHPSTYVFVKVNSIEPTTVAVATFRTVFGVTPIFDPLRKTYLLGKGIDILLLDSLCVNEEHSSLKLSVY